MTTDVSYRKSCVPCVQRGRICNPNCVFLPYFPWSRSTEYWSALRLLGFARICKIMNSVDVSERKPAGESILALGRAWEDNPVHGSIGAIRKLIEEIRLHQKELEIVNRQLEYYRGRGEGKLDPCSADPQPLMHQVSIHIFGVIIVEIQYIYLFIFYNRVLYTYLIITNSIL